MGIKEVAEEAVLCNVEHGEDFQKLLKEAQKEEEIPAINT